MAVTGIVSTEECGTCKSPTKETSRSLCATCLNRNLQKACQKTVVLSAVIRPRLCCSGAQRVLFPGMPRAVLGPANLEKGHHIAPPVCSSRTSFPEMRPTAVVGPVNSEEGHHTSPPACRVTVDGNTASLSSGVGSPHLKSEGDSASLRDASNDSETKKAELEDEKGPEGRSQKVELADEEIAQGRSSRGGEPEKELSVEGKGAEFCAEKWHLFQMQKNLTVRIPNSPIDFPTRPGHCQPLFVVHSKEQNRHYLPARKEGRPKAAVRPSNARKSSIKQSSNAEAELMMRLLADSMPILKSTAPLPLPPCEGRPASISPLSPPGDPLWKRRCIPCPKSLKVQVSSICVS